MGQANLEGIIVGYLDKMDNLEDQVDKDIDSLLKQLDIDIVIDNPEEELNKFANRIQARLQEVYHAKAIEEGAKLARKTQPDGNSKDKNKSENELSESKR